MPRTLINGSAGDDVSYLQEKLNSLPPTLLPPLVIDGDFGAQTQARVEEYQNNNGLTADGNVGPSTWTKLLKHATTKSPGFFVLGRNLYDRLGVKVLLRGVNKMCVFDRFADPKGLTSFSEIKQTGANTVRIVWAITTDLQPNGPATSTATLDELISNAIANRLIPMIELHDATGDWGRLGELVDYWTQPSVVTIIEKHAQHLLVNIGNEVGDDTVSQEDFVKGYTDAIQRMRAAGIHTPLVIDASDFGKNLIMLNDTAATLLAADPEYNIVFSVHLYWSISCGADEAFIRSNLQQAVDLDYPLVVGEFSQFGGFPCGSPPGTSMCSEGGKIDYQTILSACHGHGIGWYAWEWGPGNDFNDPLCAVMDMTPDRLFANLKPGWAREVALDSPFSINNTSVTPASI
jgi:mannan endo-1,4-beta-mannosidase